MRGRVVVTNPRDVRMQDKMTSMHGTGMIYGGLVRSLGSSVCALTNPSVIDMLGEYDMKGLHDLREAQWADKGYTHDDAKGM